MSAVAPGAAPANVATTGTRGTLPFVIDIEGGQGSLVLKGLPLSSLGRIDHMSMAVPDLRFPFDLTGGAGRFRNRRCVLRAATLSFGAADIALLLQHAPLAAHGLSRPTIEMGPDGFTLQARVEVAGHAAELTAAGYVRVAPPRGLRLACYDLRLHGFVPVAAPQIVTALLQSVAGAALSEAQPLRLPRRPAVQLHGPAEVIFDPLELALYDVFPTRGWRLPARDGLGLQPLGHAGERLLLTYQRLTSKDEEDLEEFAWGGTGTRGSGRAAYEEGRSLFAEAEALLGAGDVAAALAHYRRAATLHSSNVFVATRLLQLLTSDRSAFREAEQLASALLARNPQFAPALLARAVAAGERDRPAEAADLYERLAKVSDPLPALETATALTAAAEMYLAAGQTERAASLLESVRAARPAHPRALDLLRQLYAQDKRWGDWLALLRRRELEEPDAPARAKLLADAGRVLLDELAQPTRAAERFAEAVVLDDTLAEAWQGLGRSRKHNKSFDGARVALERAVGLFAAQGALDEEAHALTELADCEEAAGVDAAAEAHWGRAIERAPTQVAWLRRRARVLARLGRGEEAAELLERASAAARDAAPGDAGADAHVDLEVERAGLLGRVLGDRARGRMALEDVLRTSPAHLGALDELAAQASDEDLPDVLIFFERALEHITDPSVFAAVLARARDVATRAGEDAFVARALAAAARTGSAAGARAAVAWAEHLLDGAREGAAFAVPPALRAALAQYRAERPKNAVDAEVALVQGRLLEAEGELNVALDAYADGVDKASSLDALIELAPRAAALAARLDQPARAAQALEEAARRLEPADPSSADAAKLATVLIHAAQSLVQAGDQENALRVYTDAAARDPQRTEPWQALEAHHEAKNDVPALVEALRQHALAAHSVERRDTLTRLGLLLSAEPDRLAEADEAYAAALEQDAEHVPALVWLADRAWEAGRLDESAVLSQRLINIFDRGEGATQVTRAQKADAHLRLARWDRLMGSAGDADDHLARALACEPDGGALALLVDVLESFDDRDTLIAALQKRLDAPPPDAQSARSVESELAAALERAGRSEEALVVYRRRLANAADDVETLRRLVELCRRESRFDELLDTLERLLALSSELTPVGESVDRDRDMDAKVLRLEIARALWRSGRDVAGAEVRLRTLVQEDPAFVEAAETLGRLLLSRGAWQQADQVLADAGLLDGGADIDAPPATSALTVDPDEPALVVERARARLEGEAGDAAAYAVLAETPLEQLPPVGLAMRATLARTLGHTEDVAAALTEATRRLTEDVDAPLPAHDREGYLKLAELHGQAGAPLPLLERLSRRGPIDAATASQLAQLYQGLGNSTAWGQAAGNIIELLENGTALPAQVRGNLWMKLAHQALEQEDYPIAEERFARALAEPVTGPVRADWLVARAAFAIGQNALDAALADLDEALAADAQHAGALAALGDLSYRLHDWAEARRAYDALAASPDAAHTIEPAVLAYRQAELSEMFGDETAAEANYNKVLALDANHAGAREALAQYAYMREEHREVVRLLTPLLEHPVPELAARRSALHERLGECLLALGETHTARTHLQTAVRLEPTRLSALQLLTQAQETLGDHAAAAESWNRLSRLYPGARERASALYREGELRRSHLGDAGAAVDAYLRSADMDPTFAPALVRLIPYYWQRGDILEVAGVAADLHASDAGRTAAAEGDLGLVLSIASAAAGDDVLAAKVAPSAWPAAEEVGQTLSALVQHAPDATAGATRLSAAWAFLLPLLVDDVAQAVKSHLLAPEHPFAATARAVMARDHGHADAAPDVGR